MVLTNPSSHKSYWEPKTPKSNQNNDQRRLFYANSSNDTSPTSRGRIREPVPNRSTRLWKTRSWRQKKAAVVRDLLNRWGGDGPRVEWQRRATILQGGGISLADTIPLVYTNVVVGFLRYVKGSCQGDCGTRSKCGVEGLQMRRVYGVFPPAGGVFSPCIQGAWLLRGKGAGLRLKPKTCNISNSALKKWLPQSNSSKTRFGGHLSQGDQREYKRKVNVQGQLIRILDLCIATWNNIT